MKIHQYFSGHMTKVAAMSIYGKNTLKSSLQELLAVLGETLYEASETNYPGKLCANYHPGLTLTNFRQGQILPFWLLHGEM